VPSTIRFGRFELRPAERQLLIDGRPAVLGARAFDLLSVLVEHRQRVVPKNELLDLVWPGLVVEENNLQVQISALRKLLGAQVIRTVPGRGYQFTLPLDDFAAAEAASGAAAADVSQPLTEGPRGNLPLKGAAMIGRDDEFRELSDLLTTHRLITITGAGGMGKTTLALEVAAAVQEQFKDGAWLVELAPVNDPERVAQAVAQALRIEVKNPAAAPQRLVDVLASQELLLVLDSCEHLADATARLAHALNAHAPAVRILITSQKLLKVPGETVFKLGPLAIPDDDRAEALDSFGAVRLFLEKVRAVQARFAVSSSNAGAIADICRRLDGMPLAIELAATRVRLFGVQGVRERLDQRLKLLAGGSSLAAPRHQALLAMIEWSHDLLSEFEQAVLRRLGVFVGGFSIELAQRVAGSAADEWTVAEALGALVDCSLMQADACDPPRYRLLESTRAFALERLTQAGEAEATRQRHAHAVRDLFVQTEEQRFGEHGTLTMDEYMRRLAPELDNLRAALDWSMSAGNDVDTAIGLVGASSMLFRWLGRSQEGLVQLLALKSHVEAHPDGPWRALFWSNAHVLGDLGGLPSAELLDANIRCCDTYRASGERRRLYRSLSSVAWQLSQLDRAAEAANVVAEMHSIERLSDPPWLRALRLNVTGTIHLGNGEFEAAVAIHREQRALLLHAVGEEASLVIAQSNLCAALNSLQRFDAAIEVANANIDCARRSLSSTRGYTMFQLLHAQLSLGRLAEAEATMREAMPAWRRDAMVHFGAHHLAMLLAEQGRFTEAARVDGAASAYDRRSGVRPGPVRTLARRRTLELLEAARLDPADVARWQREGESLDENTIAGLCEEHESARALP
jgi:predicted ATPase/DNA-binding winged helix-turn-helix (wHTH) protein